VTNAGHGSLRVARVYRAFRDRPADRRAPGGPPPPRQPRRPLRRAHPLARRLRMGDLRGPRRRGRALRAAPAAMNTLTRVRTGLAVLGRIHALLQTFSSSPAAAAPRFANYVAASGLVESVAAGTRRIRAWRPSPSKRGWPTSLTSSPAPSPGTSRTIPSRSAVSPCRTAGVSSVVACGDGWGSRAALCHWTYLGRRASVGARDVSGPRAWRAHLSHPPGARARASWRIS